MDEHLPGHLSHGMDVDLRGGIRIASQPSDLQSWMADLEVLQDVLDFLIALNPLLFGLLGDFQRTRERVVDVVGVESRSNLVDVTVNKPLGPGHDGIGLRARVGSRRHDFNGERGGVRERRV